MTMRILVAYASRHGGTAAIAKAIGAELTAQGHRPEVASVESVRDIDAYQAVILGSAVYFGRWRSDALAFGHRFARELRARPVWLFDSGPLNPSPDAGTNEPVREADALAKEVAARGRTTFGGRLTESEAGLLVRRIMKSGRAGSYGDFRNFERIRAWARAIGVELGASQPITAI